MKVRPEGLPYNMQISVRYSFTTGKTIYSQHVMINLTHLDLVGIQNAPELALQTRANQEGEAFSVLDTEPVTTPPTAICGALTVQCMCSHCYGAYIGHWGSRTPWDVLLGEGGSHNTH